MSRQDQVVRLHGFPTTIVSDPDNSQFILEEIVQAARYSVAYEHGLPSSNGRPNRADQSMSGNAFVLFSS